MLRNFLYRLIERRHYWRTVGFSELAELYANRMLRLMAINMVSGVIGVFMYQLGYPLWQILGFYAIFGVARVVLVVPAAYFIARYGPKHAMLASSILYIPGLISMTQLSGSGIAALASYIVLVAASMVIYNVAYHVSFSKVKHSDHVGKEIGFMYVVEKLGAGLSPVVGGFVAFWLGPEATLWAASLLFLLSTAPLFFSPEPVITHQRIIFRGFHWKVVWRQLLSSAAVGVDQYSSLGVWTLFISVAVLGIDGNAVYAKLGVLTTIAFISSLVFSRAYGLIIDRHKGGELLRLSVAGNFIVHLMRPFVSTPFGIVCLNTFNEAATSGYAMPYLKGVYDMADSLPGYRIVYITLLDMAAYIGASLSAVLLAVLAYVLPGVTAFQVGYWVIAFVTLGIMVHGFPALRRAPFYVTRGGKW